LKKKNDTTADDLDPTTKAFEGDYGEAFPNSQKIFLQGGLGVSVPMREIALSGGEPSIQVPDTSGPLSIDPQLGCQK